MGRNKKYFTDEEINECNRSKSKRYYARHREEILRRRMQKYWKSVDKKMSTM